MFGLSATKILLLLLVIGAVIIGTRIAGRIARDKAEREKPPERSERTTDLSACPACGVFLSPGVAKDCGRAGCPYAA